MYEEKSLIIRVGLFATGYFMSVLVFIGCATTSLVTSDRIKTEMAAIADDVGRDRSYINRLVDKRIGRSGYFYIVNNDGTVVFHPQSRIIGTSFINHWFINKVIDEKNGCLSYRLTDRTFIRTFMIFYRQLNEDEILCLSILAEDMQSVPPDCRPPDVK